MLKLLSRGNIMPYGSEVTSDVSRDNMLKLLRDEEECRLRVRKPLIYHVDNMLKLPRVEE